MSEMRGKYRIGLIEDHEAVVLGMQVILNPQPDLELAAVARSVDGLLVQCSGLDLAVLDLRLSDGSSPQSNIERLAAAGIGTLVFTGAEDPFLVRSALRAGVLGLVLKSAPAAKVVAAIRAAASGQQTGGAGDSGAVDDERAGDVALSPRQIEILKLYASGEKAEKVARMVGPDLAHFVSA